MGFKEGDFTSIDGRTYVVLIKGRQIPNQESGAITLATDPVRITMSAGERKFVGFKSTECTARISTDEPMDYLYANSMGDLQLIIKEAITPRDQVTVFTGYILPFSFDQPLTGCNDDVEIHAVDAITSLKDIPYAPIAGTQATDAYAIDIIKAICQLSMRIDEIIVHANLGRDEGGNLIAPLNFSVAQTGFIQNGMSYTDALSEIAMFAGFTANVVGNVLYLYDEHYALAEGDTAMAYRYMYDSEFDEWNYITRPLMAPTEIGDISTDIKMNVERAYDAVQISPEGVEVSQILPEVLTDEAIMDIDYDDMRPSEYLQTNYADRITILVPQLSKYLNTGVPSSSGLVPPKNDEHYDYLSDPLISGSIPMVYYYTGIDKDKADPYKKSNPVRNNMMWIDARRESICPILMQKDDCMVTHTNGYMRILMECRPHQCDELDVPMVPEENAIYKNYATIPWLHILCGGEELRSLQNGGIIDWSNNSGPSPLFIGQQAGLGSKVADEHWDSGFVVKVPSNNPISILGWPRDITEVTSLFTIYLTRLSIEGVGDAINEKSPELYKKYIDEPIDVLDVPIKLTSRHSGVTDIISGEHRTYGVNARPCVVTDLTWSGYEGRIDNESVPLSGALITQLADRYATTHPAYTMTALDQGIKTYAPVMFRGKKYTVDAYERDLYNDEITITID